MVSVRKNAGGNCPTFTYEGHYEHKSNCKLPKLHVLKYLL